MMRSQCPVCDSTTGFDRHEVSETVTVRGEDFEVRSTAWRCRGCGEVLDGEDDPLELAYDRYRDGHGIPRAVAIRRRREALGLTQRELGDLLGWGSVTLSRYENGALPSEAHGRALARMMGAAGLADAMDAAQDAIPAEKRQAVMDMIRDDLVAERARKTLEAVAGGFPAGLATGLRAFSSDRAVAAMVALTEGGEFKTKLNKLLFYADFKAFKELGASITGMRYARLDYGPVPNNYKDVLSSMEIMGVISCEPREAGSFGGEVVKPVRAIDPSVLSAGEREVILQVKARFRGMSASEIAEFSHRERAWKEVPNSGLISYDYARYLLI